MAENSITITDDNFQNEVLESPIPVLVDFWAPWCGPCVAIGPTLETLAEEYKGKFKVCKMNVDENANIPAEFGVRSIPYLAFFKNGELVESAVGSQSKGSIEEIFSKILQ